MPTTPADVDAIVNDALSVVSRERQSTTSFVGPKVCVCVGFRQYIVLEETIVETVAGGMNL